MGKSLQRYRQWWMGLKRWWRILWRNIAAETSPPQLLLLLRAKLHQPGDRCRTKMKLQRRWSSNLAGTPTPYRVATQFTRDLLHTRLQLPPLLGGKSCRSMISTSVNTWVVDDCNKVIQSAVTNVLTLYDSWTRYSSGVYPLLCY